RRRQMDTRAGRSLQTADPRRLRSARQPVARNRAAVGRRHHRPGANAGCAGPGVRGDAERADPGAAAVRRVPDVMMSSRLSQIPARELHLLYALALMCEQYMSEQCEGQTVLDHMRMSAGEEAYKAFQ